MGSAAESGIIVGLAFAGLGVALGIWVGVLKLKDAIDSRWNRDVQRAGSDW